MMFHILLFMAVLVSVSHTHDAKEVPSSAQTPVETQLPFVLPFDETNYNEIHLSESAGAGGSAAVAYWTADEDIGVIRVALATTQRWVAFGLNPSTPTMTGSDIVSCSRKDGGKVVSQDYFANSYGMPKKDEINDWTVIGSGFTGNIGVWCEITRPFITCDRSEDFQLFDTGASISALMSFGVDASSAEMHYHGMNRRFTSFVFDEKALAAEHEMKPSSSEIRYEHVITSPVSTIPHDSTGAEICSYHRLPDRMRGVKHHVVDVQVSQTVKQAQQAGLTHHTILYGCRNDVVGAVDGAEIDCAKTWEFCGSDWLGGRLIRANEGVPVGQGITVATILLRHFYNPNLLRGYQDQNSWKISYTPNLRPYEPVEIQFQTQLLNIPPQQTSTTSVYMPAECTERIGKIKLEAVRHHMHDYGIAGKLRHIRGDKELEPIHEMKNYVRGISEGWISVQRQILPGDMLIYECTYRNTLKQGVVWGERREDEMCVIALKTRGTNISNVNSFPPNGVPWNPSKDSYLFYCKAPQWAQIDLSPINIPKVEFESRLVGITPYSKPPCNGLTAASPLIVQVLMAVVLSTVCFT